MADPIQTLLDQITYEANARATNLAEIPITITLDLDQWDVEIVVNSRARSVHLDGFRNDNLAVALTEALTALRGEMLPRGRV